MGNESLSKRIDETHRIYRQVTERLIENSTSISAMESCTSGLIASLITDTAGASSVFRGSLVTYSNEAKIRFGVPEEIIKGYGVYSEETVTAMASVCRTAFCSDIGIGVSGSLGTADPNNSDSVPGEVWYAVCAEGHRKQGRIVLSCESTRFEDKLRIAASVGGSILSLLNDMTSNEAGRRKSD